MGTIKIIDLLNKIANGEEVPTTIKYQDNYYNLIRKYNEDWEEYEFGYKNSNGGYLNIWRDSALNDTVEILEEEKKIPEKLSTWFSLEKDCENDNIQYANNNFETMYEKINEICDYLKSKGDE